MLRMSGMPQIHMKVIVTDNPPTGMGEVGIPCVAPAIGNAVASSPARFREVRSATAARTDKDAARSAS